MQVLVEEMTGQEWIYKAAQACNQDSSKEVRADALKLYRSEHSIIRARWFWVQVEGMPYFVHTHFRTHRVGGTEHWTQTGREDRGADSNERWGEVRHTMMVNAQELISMSRVRLCNNAHKATRDIMLAIRGKVSEIDPALASCMVPNCEYRGQCTELRPCGAMW